MAHTYVIGQSGSGKSTLLKERMIEHIRNGDAVCFVDPHGTDTDDLLQYIPRKRIKDTIVFDPLLGISWNPLVESDNQPLTATILTDAIKDAWGYHGVTTPVLEMVLFFTLSSLIERKKSLYDSLSLITKERFYVSDDVLNSFWENFEAMTPKEQRELTSSTLNKLYTLFGDKRIRDMFNKSKGRYSVSETVKDKITFVRLRQGELGLSKASLIGSILLSVIHLACYQRDTTIPFHLYIDEVQHFAPSVLSEMLSGLRKFNVNITVAHQYIDQLDRQLFTSLMGNCPNRIAFRVSPEDSVRLHFGKRGLLDLHEMPPFDYREYTGANYTDKCTEPLTSGNSSTPKRIIDNTILRYC